MTVTEHPSREALAEALAARVADALRAALAARGRASLALPGGTTPGPFMEALARQPLDWAAVTVLPTDERWVPADHPRSNAALIRRHLLRDAAAAAAVLDLHQPGTATPREAEAAVAARVAPLLPLDVLVLGMGEDLHMASLFPDAPRIAEALAADAPAVMAMQGPLPEAEPRISLTLPALSSAAHRFLLLTGAGKRAALDRAAGLGDVPPSAAPILALLPGLAVHWAA